SRQKGGNHDRFFSVALDQKSSWNRSYAIRDEEGEWQEGRRRKIDLEAGDYVGHDRSQDIGQQGHHEECQVNNSNHVRISFHVIPWQSLSMPVRSGPAHDQPVPPRQASAFAPAESQGLAGHSGGPRDKQTVRRQHLLLLTLLFLAVREYHRTAVDSVFESFSHLQK